MYIGCASQSNWIIKSLIGKKNGNMSLQKYCMKNIDLLIFLINFIDHSADMKIAS